MVAGQLKYLVLGRNVLQTQDQAIKSSAP